MTDVIDQQRLRLMIERVERLFEERDGISADIRDVMAEAKAVGFDPKTLRSMVKLRAMDSNDRMASEDLRETYKAALGLAEGSALSETAIAQALAAGAGVPVAPPPPRKPSAAERQLAAARDWARAPDPPTLRNENSTHRVN